MESTSISLSSRVKSSRNWLELPSELTASILMRVGSVDLLLSARKVCKTWRRICSDPDLWRIVDMRYTGIICNRWTVLELFDNPEMEEAAKHAVDLSCGQMIKFNAEYFGSDDLIRYISERSSQLRRLRLASCKSITDKGLSEMVKKLPLLEELHLSNILVSKQAIEVIGRCCPQLKSFSLNRQDFGWPYSECDEEALAIAENMPGLRHVQLHGNTMTRLGLTAILVNCLHLESLDIWKCVMVANLGHDMERWLSQLINNIRLPLDSTEDYEFVAEIYDSSEVDYPFRLPVISGGSDRDSDSENYVHDVR